MIAAEIFVKALENEGVDFVFGIPGEETLDLLEALRKSKKIKFILTRHEQAAGFMAATYGRLTGNAGVCLTTLGPGATNLVTAAAHAQLGAMPMLMITGQKPIKESKQGRFQILDVVNMMRPITKFTDQIVYGNNVPYMVREVFRIAEEERPGAVHLELPEDVAAEEVSEPILMLSNARRPIADPIAIDEAVAMIEKSKYPLLLIGAAANRKRTSQMLNLFIEKFGFYFMDTQLGQGVVDGRNTHYVGNAALSDNDVVHYAVHHADLIINVGHDVVEKPPFLMEANGFKVLHINFLSAGVDRVYFPQCEVLGDISNSIRMISEKLSPQKHWDFEYYKHVGEKVRANLNEGSDDYRFPISPQKLVRDTRSAMPDDGIVALDNGIYKIWFCRNYPTYQQNTLLLDNALATMGAGLPSAIAAKLIYPDRKVLAVCGDGGFMMNSQELETAVRLNLDLVVIILKDDSYGMIRWKQEAAGIEDFGLKFGNPDFIKYAESYGAFGVCITETKDFLVTLKECLDKKGVYLIELPVDYTENNRVLTKEMLKREKDLDLGNVI